MVQRALETYGYSPKGVSGLAEKRQSFWDFVLMYLVTAVGFVGLGIAVREFSVVVASVLYLIALLVFSRGFWAWCNSRRKTVTLLLSSGIALLAFICLDSSWIREKWTPTFLYLTPTHELIDCERRAFFVNHSGFEVLQNVRVVIKDNKNGAVLPNDDYKTGIEPGPQNPDAPRYIWVKPSSPWDEDYTITVTGTKYRSVQEMVLRSTNQTVQFAVRITVDPMKKPVVSCRDGR
jgi:energy-coupling factor transporter transmembrane protein EcfT